MPPEGRTDRPCRLTDGKRTEFGDPALVNLPRLRPTSTVLELISGDSRAIEVVGTWGSAKSLIAAQTAEALNAPLVLITASRVEADAIFDDLSTFTDPDRCALFPAWEVLPSDAMEPSDDIVAERMNALVRLASAPAESPMRVVLPVASALQYVIAPKALAHRSLTLAAGEEHDLEELLARLTGLGYERELMVERRGHMSVRGCIFDVFPISSELPYRIEFFGDVIESIRRFEPETQRSIDQVGRIRLVPRSEKRTLLSDPDGLAPIAAYLPENAIVALDEPLAVAEEARKLRNQVGDAPLFISWDETREHLARFVTLSLAQVAHAGDAEVPRVTAPMRSVSGWEPPAEDFWSQLTQWDADGYTVLVLCNNTGERSRMLELLEEHGHRPGSDAFDLRIGVGRIREGFVSAENGLAVLSEKEIFGRHYVRRSRRRFEAGAVITNFSDLKAGDYVVHAHHGIGRYLGLRRFQGKAGDFLAVQYAKGDKLYLPVTHIDAIQKYAGSDSAGPKVDRLGGATWARTKARVKKAVRDMSRELLQLYATRESQLGHAFGQDSPWQLEFEDAFEYEETPDQARSIVDVKRDMQLAKPMDRLLCGDVGYGKTEVALRAAFKAVQDGKQAAVLVPTTVLAEQHYMTFSERLADYPVTVDMLSRFRTAKEQKQTVERLESGEVDIVIGTHRLLSKDMKFKDLGLLVIDEEHRFGVAQKERLKALRALVDVLTMTATPIPRTLNLSLVGVRDMSIINTAPNDRLPVHTCIEHFDERLIKEAIKRELARQGQVFFVHNRVQTILPFAELVRRLVPDARVAVGHGQMPEAELERVMTRFIHDEVDVLVCTTIIGSGLDIPNANTIIINNADHFGLSELYQLRGRVGRYKHRAFAYLLVSGDRALSEDAQKRLKALEDFSTLGSGFRIAMRDLEIRGCGNILGAEQHGHIAAVGLETYSQLLSETIAELKGEPVEHRALPQLEMAIDAYIPEEYVPSEAQKITLYKRIAGATTIEEVDEMEEEVADRFGPTPAPVKRLFSVMRVRAQAAELGVKRIAAATSAIAVEFESNRFLSRRARNTLAQHFGPRLTFSFRDAPSLTYQLETASTEQILTSTRNLLEAMADV